MTEFKRTVQAVDEIEQLVGSTVDGQNEQLPRLDQLLRETEPTLEKIRKKASDANSAYGPQMRQKVADLCERWDSLKTVAKDVLQQRAPDLAAAAAASEVASQPAPSTSSQAAGNTRAPWMNDPVPISNAVPSPAQMDARARPAVPSSTTSNRPTPTAAERREQQARAAEARIRAAGGTPVGQPPPEAAHSSSSSANPASTTDGSVVSLVAAAVAAGTDANALTEAQRPVLSMESLLHLVHCVFLGHSFDRSDGGDEQATHGVHRVRYIHKERSAVLATYVIVQRHLLVYAHLEGSSVPTRVALCLGMTAASVQAKTDYLLVYPLVYHFCMPSLPCLPVEVTFSVLACFSIPSLAAVGVTSKGLATAVFEDDVLWWRVLLNLPQTPDLRAAVDSALRRRGQQEGQVLPAGECRRLVRGEVIRLREEEARRRRAREEAMERERRNPLRVGPPRFPGQPFPGGPFGPFGGRGQIGGDHDLFPGGLDPFGGGRRGPFGGGGGGFGGFH